MPLRRLVLVFSTLLLCLNVVGQGLLEGAVEEQLKVLKRGLALRPEQEKDWKGFSAAMVGHLNNLPSKNPVPEMRGLSREEVLQEEHRRSFREFYRHVNQFYDRLDGEQQEAFDSLFFP